MRINLSQTHSQLPSFFAKSFIRYCRDDILDSLTGDGSRFAPSLTFSVIEPDLDHHKITNHCQTQLMFVFLA